MKDDLTRRDFLRATGLAVTGIGGALLASSNARAQEEDEKKKGEKKDEEPDDDDLFDDDSGEEETRACPQCGALMYRQGRTWTCDNCGYSYVE